MAKQEKKTKTYKTLERHFKAIANHRRLQALIYLSRHPDTTLDELTEQIKCNFRTMSTHMQKMVNGGLVEKRYRGREVLHNLTPYGTRFVSFVKEFGNI